MNPKIKLISLIKKAAGPKFGPSLPPKPKPVNSGVIPAPLAPLPAPGGKGKSGVVPLPLAGKEPKGPAFQRLDNKQNPQTPAPAAPPKNQQEAAAPGMFGSLGGMLEPVQKMMEGIGVEGAAPYAGFLAPLLKPLVNVAGPLGSAGLTDLLFHRGENIRTLTSGLSNRSGNIPKA